MKLHKRKRNGILIVLVFGIITSVYIVLSFEDLPKTLREEVQIFYSTDLQNCAITQLKQKDYPTNKEKYTLFKTDCDDNYFPILFLNMTPEDVELFQENAQISKDKNSYLFKLSSNNMEKNFEIRKINTLEQDITNSLIFFLTFLVMIVVVYLLIPNKTFDRPSMIRRNS